MCLILVGLYSHPRYPLVVAANRDELFARPSLGAHYWVDAPHVLGGRDLQGGGTWLGTTRQGRLAAVTNFRRGTPAPARCSRGDLTRDFLLGQAEPASYSAGVLARAGDFNGFNLLLGLLVDGRVALSYTGHGSTGAVALAPGIYGLSNGLLDSPWPKVEQGKAALAGALHQGATIADLFALLADREIAPDARLPDTGMALTTERLLSARFIHSPGYGTRTSTVLRYSREGVLEFYERNFGADGEQMEQRQFCLRTGP